ncbi:MAG: Chromosome partitioning protein ParA [Syntrophomonadaceae bacterium]|nr:Chromosome partitioning protein ParA [Bacillota bacterium]
MALAMKTIATLNFKGGVGKTTTAWLLANYLAKEKGKRALLMDMDAQMSLTLAITLQERTGRLNPVFQSWYEGRHIKKRNTILDGLDAYDRYARGRGSFDFPVGADFIFTQLHPNLGFVPSVSDLYWLELEVFDRDATRTYIKDLLTRVSVFLKKEYNYEYDYCFLDCPPSFSLLSYSTLCRCDLVLLPVNPDVFAARGVEIMLEGLELKIAPYPLPKVLVFMNKAKTWGGTLTRETSFFLAEVQRACNQTVTRQQVQVETADAWIPERVDIKRAIPRGEIPRQFMPHFAALWDHIERFI